MNKLLGALAVSAVLTGSTYANPFSDVPAGHWAYGAVNSVVNSGMMKGYPKGIFKGKETVNRYQMATIISRLLKRSGGSNDADVRRTLDRLGEEFMDELDLIGARLTALEGAFNEHVNEGGDANGFNFSGEARVRWENQTEDLTNTALKDDDSRWQGRTLLNVEKSVDRADFFVQLQYDHTFGNGGNDANNADINQAWVDLSITDDSSIKLGRQAVEIGNGAIIGRHDHLQNPYSYDGWVFNSSYDDIGYNVWSLRQTAGAVDTDLHGLDVNFSDVYGGALNAHYYHFTGLGTPATAGNSLDTYGFDYSRDYEEWDFYVQYAAQSGDQTAAIEYDGELLNLAVGYDVDEDDKIGLSYTSYSGDDTATAASNEGWQHLNLGDAHSFLGFADVFAQSNIEDITFTWDRQLDEKNSFHLAYHMFQLDDSSSDAAILNLNGWTGLTEAASTGANDDDLGTELDLIWGHKLSDDVDLALGYAMFDAGDYFTTNKTAGTVSPDATYAWLNANVKF